MAQTSRAPEVRATDVVPGEVISGRDQYGRPFIGRRVLKVVRPLFERVVFELDGGRMVTLSSSQTVLVEPVR
jgi:hypothetical protein